MSEVKSEAFSMSVCEGSATGENIFNLLNGELTKNNLTWDKSISFGCDNVDVMVGKERGVFVFIKRVNSAVYLGCVCHLIHVAAEKGSKCLPFAMDEILMGLYCYLEKSSKRLTLLAEMQVLHDMKQTKMLKRVSIRWLSINRCLGRLLESWEALCAFFKAEKSSSTATSSYQNQRLQRLHKFFTSPTNRLFCLFLQCVLAIFDKYNTELQCSEPKIHALRRGLISLFRELLIQFVKPSAILYKDILDVDFQPLHAIKANKDTLIGTKATEFLDKKNENNLREERITEFFKCIKDFFTTSCQYIKKKLPLTDELFQNAEVADVEFQASSKMSSLVFFLDRFPCLLGQFS